ncbi:MAG: PH domain-containing protein [Chitinophagaceae bacterium]|nr:PH domain-containing protein [Chitinophagaceae bacterium]
MRTPLQKDEKVLLITRTSWITLILPAFLALVGLIIAYFIDFFGWGLAASVPLLLYFLYKYLEWRVNIWGVTNYRVIDETGLLSHYAKESPLEKINNVSYDQTLFGRILNYGHVEIQTAAEIGSTDYHNVHGPKLLKDTITLGQADYKTLQLTSQAVHMANAIGLNKSNTSQSGSSSGIATELEKLFELKQKGVLSEEEYSKAKSRILNS